MSYDPNLMKTSMKYQNKFYENDFEYDIELSRFLLRITGVWPTVSQLSRRVSRFAIIVSVVLLIFFFVPQGCYVFLVEEDSTAKLRMAGPLSFTAMAIAKYAIVLARHEGIESCIDCIANDWRQADDTFCRPIMLRYARTSRMITKLYVAFTFGGVGFHTGILPFFNNRDEGNSTGRPFAYPSEFYVIDAQTSPMYELIFIGQSISMLAIVCTLTCGVCTITVKLVLHACSQYKIVVAFVRSVDDHYYDDDDYKNTSAGKSREIFVKRRLAEIIQRHLHAIAFVAQIEKVLNETCLVDLMGSTLNICVLGYDLITGWEDTDLAGVITYVVLMTAFVTNVFLFCYIGERLTEQCNQVVVAGYMTNWWGLPETQAKALILMIATSDIPVKFTAGKIVNLSMETFASVMKASMAYLNPLRSIM